MKNRKNNNKIIHFIQIKNYKLRRALNKLIQKHLNSVKKLFKI